jgi:hypothetical protein
MATPTYTALATLTASGGETSVTFSSIPATYRDLILVWNGTASGNQTVLVRFNSDSGSNYSYVYAYGDGSSKASGSGTGTSITQNYLFTNPTVSILQIMDYSATDKHKTVISRWNTAQNALQMNAERWANTAAITTVECSLGAGSINSGTTFSLYGIEA